MTAVTPAQAAHDAFSGAEAYQCMMGNPPWETITEAYRLFWRFAAWAAFEAARSPESYARPELRLGKCPLHPAQREVQVRSRSEWLCLRQFLDLHEEPQAQPAPARPHWLVTDFDGYWEAQGYQHAGVEFDREDLGDAFDAGAQAARDLAATAPARLEAADGVVRDVLESLCRRDGLPLESAVVPGEPARNYELADRLGVGHVFGLQPQAAPEADTGAGK